MTWDTGETLHTKSTGHFPLLTSLTTYIYGQVSLALTSTISLPPPQRDTFSSGNHPPSQILSYPQVPCTPRALYLVWILFAPVPSLTGIPDFSPVLVPPPMIHLQKCFHCKTCWYVPSDSCVKAHNLIMRKHHTSPNWETFFLYMCKVLIKKW